MAEKWALTKNGKILFKHGFVGEPKTKKAIKAEGGTIPNPFVAGADCGNGIKLLAFVDGKGKGKAKYTITETQVVETILKDDYLVEIGKADVKIESPNKRLRDFLTEHWASRMTVTPQADGTNRVSWWLDVSADAGVLRRQVWKKFAQWRKHTIEDRLAEEGLDQEDLLLMSMLEWQGNGVACERTKRLLVHAEGGTSALGDAKLKTFKTSLVEEINAKHQKLAQDFFIVSDTDDDVMLKKCLPNIALWVMEGLTEKPE